MKTLKLGICFFDENNNVITKRTIGANWQVDVEQDLKEKFYTHVDDEIAAILTENLKIQLTPEIVVEMLQEVKERKEY